MKKYTVDNVPNFATINLINNILGVKIKSIIQEPNGEFLLNCGSNADIAKLLSSSLKNIYNIGGRSRFGTKSINYNNGKNPKLEQIDVFLRFSFNQFNNLKAKLLNTQYGEYNARNVPAAGGAAAPFKKIEKKSFGSNSDKTKLNFLSLDQNDEYVSPRESNHSRVLTKEAQDAGKYVMMLTGSNASAPGFPEKEHSLLNLLKVGGVSKISPGQATYTREMLQKSLSSVNVFYDQDVLSAQDLQASLEARNPNVTYAQRKPVSPKLIHDSGHRVITANCHIFNDNKFKLLDNVVEVTTMDISAPDLNNSYNKQFYIFNGQLNIQRYKSEMSSRIKLLIKAAEINNLTTIVLPSIGAGAFANGHSVKVANAIAEAFKEILENLPHSSLNNVVFSVMGQHNQVYSKVFEAYRGNVTVTITNAEMTNVSIKLKNDLDENVGYIIAGHPTNKIGNGWKVNERGESAEAQEETCTKHFIDFIAAFDIVWNRENVLSKNHFIPVNVNSDHSNSGDMYHDHDYGYGRADEEDDFDYSQGRAGGASSGYHDHNYAYSNSDGSYGVDYSQVRAGGASSGYHDNNYAYSNSDGNYGVDYSQGRVVGSDRGNSSQLYKALLDYDNPYNLVENLVYQDRVKIDKESCDLAIKMLSDIVQKDFILEGVVKIYYIQNLNQAIRDQNLAAVKDILNKGIDLDHKIGGEESPLELAFDILSKNNSPVIQRIIDTICNYEPSNDNNSENPFIGGAPGGPDFSHASTPLSPPVVSRSDYARAGGAQKSVLDTLNELFQNNDYPAIKSLFVNSSGDRSTQKEIIGHLRMIADNYESSELYLFAEDLFTILPQDDNAVQDLSGLVDDFDYASLN